MTARLADPYRDLSVIDSRAPRFNQSVIGVVSVIAVATGWWWLLAGLAAMLLAGLTLGRQYCPTCLFYFEFKQDGVSVFPLIRGQHRQVLLRPTQNSVPTHGGT